MPDPIYPRVGVIINSTNEVSSISSRQGPSDRRDKRQEERNDFREELVPAYVRPGMIQQENGKFAWPDGHVNEPRTPAAIARFKAEQDAA